MSVSMHEVLWTALLQLQEAQNLRICNSDKAKLLYVSTSEIYGILEIAEPIKESNIGTMDILSSRSCYSSSKRCCETLCASYAAEKNTDFVIVRPGHIYGPTATRSDNRISSSFMYDSFDTPFLDLEMWFASCNLGYKNKRIRDAVVNQIDTLPQISSHFQYDYKVLSMDLKLE